MKVDEGLPAGWTIERVRAVSGDAEAVLLSPDRPTVYAGAGDAVPLRPDLVIGCHDLCVVREDGDWHMGSVGPDGSIVCWSSYGPDLEEALRGL